MSAPHTQAWLSAARDPEIAAQLEAVYRLAADQIEARGPACWASGRCCNFDAAGHRLYVTGLEAAYTVTRLEQGLAHGDIDRARETGGCPFQIANLCGAHAIKPLGCRTYFCDRASQDWQHELTERGVELVRRIHDEHDLEYRYGEWRSMLELFVSGGARA